MYLSFVSSSTSPSQSPLINLSSLQHIISLVTFSAGCRKEDAAPAASKVIEVVAPLLRQLSGGSVDEEILLRQGKYQQHASASSASTEIAAGKGGGGGTGTAAGGTAASSTTTTTTRDDIELDRKGGGGVAADGLERVRLDAERQILLTMLLAHMCASNDATPRTFVEQVGVSLPMSLL